MTTAAIKVTSKGQITIPREVRDRLQAHAVYFEFKDDLIILKPIRDAAMSLQEYAGKVPPGRSMKRMKETAWEESTREKTVKKSS